MPATRDQDQAEGELLAALPRRGPDDMPQEMRVTLERYQGNPYIRMQLWADTVSGWRPLAGKLATIRRAEVADVIQALRRAAETMNADSPVKPRGGASRAPSPRGGRGGPRRGPERADGGERQQHWTDKLPPAGAAKGGGFSELD